MKIQLKRSNVLDGGSAKEPTAAQMEYGELAVNYNSSDPSLFIKASDNSIKKVGINSTAIVTSVDTGTGLTGGPITSTGTVSLANTTVNPGSYTSPDLTVDAQGRITAASSGSAPVTSVDTGTGLTGGPITSTGTVSLANTTVNPGSYSAADITVDAQGRITAAADGGGNGGFETIGAGANTESFKIGTDALSQLTTTGNYSFAAGYEALKNTTTSGAFNVAVGYRTLTANTTGSDNIALGLFALNANTTGFGNFVAGSYAMYNQSTGIQNTAIGLQALYSNTTGGSNLGLGYKALRSNTTGSNNIGIGFYAESSSATVSNEITLGNTNITKFRVPGINFILKDNSSLPSTGQVLTADSSGEGYWADSGGGFETIQSGNSGESFRIGTNALSNLTPSSSASRTYSFAAGYEALKNANPSIAGGGGAFGNVAIGYRALSTCTSGDYNVSLGYANLSSLTTGGYNVAVGRDAAASNTTGNYNVGIGYQSLYSNTSGGVNLALVQKALENNTTGEHNVGLGYQSLRYNTTGSYNVGIGYRAYGSSATVNGEITLGGTTHSALRCNVQTISSLSDGRDKTEIEELPEGLAFISSLSPVKFKWKTRDGNKKDGTTEAGFIAQDLQSAQAASNADYLGLVMDENPERLEASYGKLVPMLVKAIQELKYEVEQLKANA